MSRLRVWPVAATAALAAVMPVVAWAGFALCMASFCRSEMPDASVEPGLFLLGAPPLILGAYLVAGVTLLSWQARARTIVDRVGAGSHRLSPRMAVLSWVIPVASWWLPYLVMIDLVRAVDRRPRAALVRLWWLMWLAMQVELILFVNFGLVFAGATGLGGEAESLLAWLALLTPVVAAALMITLVRTITRSLATAFSGALPPG